jgi:hypothetical protein
MRTLFRSLAVAVVLIALGAVLGPWLENLAYAIRLGAMPAPAALPVPVAGVKPSRLADTWGGARKHDRADSYKRTVGGAAGGSRRACRTTIVQTCLSDDIGTIQQWTPSKQENLSNRKSTSS